MIEKEILNILLGIASLLLLILIHLMTMDALITDLIGIVIFIFICHRYYLSRKTISQNKK
ncbi:MAG: hypothetical protein U0L73_13295 [Ruminococcus bromii]|nr:hypothetical protein [Ruminococcus bromii]